MSIKHVLLLLVFTYLMAACNHKATPPSEAFQ